MPCKCDYADKELLMLAGDKQIISRNNFQQPLLFLPEQDLSNSQSIFIINLFMEANLLLCWREYLCV